MSIYLPIAIMLSLGTLIAIFSARWARYLSKPFALSFAVIAIVWMFIHPLYIGNRLFAAKWLPVSDVIIWSNLQPLCVGALAGIAWIKLGTPVVQRVTLLLPLCLFGIYRTIEPVVGRPAVLHGRMTTGEVTRQSSKSSCSPAACATALNYLGIAASEAELAKLCLTTARGTYPLAIYRGLKLKTEATPYRVEVFKGSLDEFLALPSAPAIVSITVSGDQRALLGASHSVMTFPFAGGDFVGIGDPFVGKYSMKREALRQVWPDEALRLVQR